MADVEEKIRKIANFLIPLVSRVDTLENKFNDHQNQYLAEKEESQKKRLSGLESAIQDISQKVSDLYVSVGRIGSIEGKIKLIMDEINDLAKVVGDTNSKGDLGNAAKRTISGNVYRHKNLRSPNVSNTPTSDPDPSSSSSSRTTPTLTTETTVPTTASPFKRSPADRSQSQTSKSTPVTLEPSRASLNLQKDFLAAAVANASPVVLSTSNPGMSTSSPGQSQKSAPRATRNTVRFENTQQQTFLDEIINDSSSGTIQTERPKVTRGPSDRNTVRFETTTLILDDELIGSKNNRLKPDSDKPGSENLNRRSVDLRKTSASTNVKNINVVNVVKDKEKEKDKEKDNQDKKISNINARRSTAEPGLMLAMQKQNVSKEQLQRLRDLLTETLTFPDKLKQFLEYARSLGSVEYTLILAWQTLQSFEELVKSKADNNLIKTSAESMWESISQAVIVPTELYETLQTKISSGAIDANIFELPKHYIETVMALLIVPSYATKYGLSAPKHTQGKKERHLKKITPRVSRLKKTNSRKKSQTNTVEKRSSKRLGNNQVQNQKITQLYKTAQTKLGDFKNAITTFEKFLEQTNMWVNELADEEQLKSCEKILTECNTYIDRLSARTNDKFSKVKTSFPEIKLDQLPKPALHRQSSVLADKLWEELCLDAELQSYPEFVVNNNNKKPRAKSVSLGKPLMKNTTLADINETNNEDKTPELSRVPSAIEKLLAFDENENDINDEHSVTRTSSLPEDDDHDENRGSSFDIPEIELEGDFPENWNLESMSDMSFTKILQSLVTCPRGSDSSVLTVDFLESNLETLKKKVSESLSNDDN